MALAAQQINPKETPGPGLCGGDSGGGVAGGKYVPPSKRSDAGGASLMGESICV